MKLQQPPYVTIDGSALESALKHVGAAIWHGTERDEPVRIRTTPDGLELATLNLERTASCVATIPEHNFTDVKGELVSEEVYVSHLELRKIVSQCLDRDVTLSIFEDDDDTVTNSLVIDVPGRPKRHLNEPDADDVPTTPIPDVDHLHTADLTIEAVALKHAVQMCRGDAESFWMRAMDPGVTEFRIWTDDLEYDTSYIGADGRGEIHDSVINDRAVSAFTIGYLRPIVDVFDAEDELTLRLGTEVPLTITTGTPWGVVEYTLTSQVVDQEGDPEEGHWHQPDTAADTTEGRQ